VVDQIGPFLEPVVAAVVYSFYSPFTVIP